jgi:uncharacterized protein YqcC (DUF446 family)
MKIADFFKGKKTANKSVRNPDKDARVMAVIDDIEAEMKAIGYWQKNPPKVKVNHYLEAPCFELWLQCVFIPNAREAARIGQYPTGSQVGQMAMREYDYHSHVEEACTGQAKLDTFC